MEMKIGSEAAMKSLGRQIGLVASGSEVVELIGDVGAGKTTLTKGIAEGLGISETVQSPTFTISRVYEARDGLTLHHYDFYRLNEAGIMSQEIAEAIRDERVITVVEWAESVLAVLPDDRLRIEIVATDENERLVQISAGGEVSRALIGSLG